MPDPGYSDLSYIPLDPPQAPSALLEAPLALLEAPSGPLEAPSAPLEASSGPLEASSGPLEAPSAPLEAPSALLEAPSAPLEVPAALLAVENGPEGVKNVVLSGFPDTANATAALMPPAARPSSLKPRTTGASAAAEIREML